METDASFGDVPGLISLFTDAVGRRRRGRSTPMPQDIREVVMADLARSFPCLKDAIGVEPFQPLTFIAWLEGRSATLEQIVTGRFLLAIWSPRTDWRKEGFSKWEPFDPGTALNVWEPAARAAFVRWVDCPIWP